MIKKSRRVIQKSLDGKIINTFASTQQAELFTKVWSSSIVKCCNGRCKTAGGFIWEYESKKLQ